MLLDIGSHYTVVIQRLTSRLCVPIQIFFVFRYNTDIIFIIEDIPFIQYALLEAVTFIF